MRPRSPKPETATALNESTIAAGITSQGREESESVTSSASATLAPSGASDGSQPETTMAPADRERRQRLRRRLGLRLARHEPAKGAGGADARRERARQEGGVAGAGESSESDDRDGAHAGRAWCDQVALVLIVCERTRAVSGVRQRPPEKSCVIAGAVESGVRRADWHKIGIGASAWVCGACVSDGVASARDLRQRGGWEQSKKDPAITGFGGTPFARSKPPSRHLPR